MMTSDAASRGTMFADRHFAFVVEEPGGIVVAEDRVVLADSQMGSYCVLRGFRGYCSSVSIGLQGYRLGPN
jgi:hypothetical protein